MWSWWDCMQWWASGAWDDGSLSWLMILPMLWPLVILIGAIVLTVILLMRSGRTETSWRADGRRQTPFEILSFARGEIDRQEFEERKGLLSQP